MMTRLNLILRPASFVVFAVLFLAAAIPAHAVEVERVVSSKGIEAWLIRDHSNPVTTLKLSFRGGAALDPENKSGLANFVASTLDEGAGDLDSRAFQRALDEKSISLRFSAGRDRLDGSLRTLNKNRDDAFEYLRLAINEPRFDETPLNRIRQQILSGIRQSQEDPGNRAGRAIFEKAFQGHPYARDNDGTLESVSAITPDDMRDFVKERLARDNLLIGVVGDIDADTLKKYLDQVFGTLPEKAKPWKVAKIDPKLSGGIEVIDIDVPQSSVQFAQPGILRNNPDFYTAYVLNYVLGGGGFVSRLYEEVREKRGLAYSVSASPYPLESSAILYGAAGTQNARAGETVAVIREEIAKIARDGVTVEELRDVKTYLTGSYPLRFDTNSKIAGQLAGLQLQGYDIDYVNRRNALIEAVTRDDIQRVAEKLMNEDAFTFVLVGQPEGLAASAQ